MIIPTHRPAAGGSYFREGLRKNLPVTARMPKNFEGNSSWGSCEQAWIYWDTLSACPKHSSVQSSPTDPKEDPGMNSRAEPLLNTAGGHTYLAPPSWPQT